VSPSRSRTVMLLGRTVHHAHHAVHQEPAHRAQQLVALSRILTPRGSSTTSTPLPSVRRITSAA
jgi:hypothetical protein